MKNVKEIILDMNMLIYKKDGSQVNYQEIEEALKDMGYEWDGVARFSTERKMKQEAYYIVESVSPKQAQLILEREEREQEIEHKDAQILVMTRLAIYSKVLVYCSEEAKKIFQENTINTKNSKAKRDIFLSYLNEALIDKTKENVKE